MSRLNIAVLFGGCSPEYGVSLQSAAAVLRHMDKGRYEPVMVGISQAGDWFHYTGPVDSIESDTWHNAETCVPAVMRPDRSAPALLVFGPEGMQKVHLDAAFPVLHGRNGEDGTVQGLLELAGIPLVGCGVLASALCMDKDRAHKLAQAAGVTIPSSTVLTKENSTEDACACRSRPSRLRRRTQMLPERKSLRCRRGQAVRRYRSV